jgi:hypothetical protein
MALISLVGNSIYIFHSHYVGRTVDHMSVALLSIGTVLAILLISFRNLFFKVQKVKLDSSLLQKRHSMIFYTLAFFVSFNMMSAFLFTEWEGSIIGFSLFLILALLSVFFLKRLIWLYQYRRENTR